MIGRRSASFDTQKKNNVYFEVKSKEMRTSPLFDITLSAKRHYISFGPPTGQHGSCCYHNK